MSTLDHRNSNYVRVAGVGGVTSPLTHSVMDRRQVRPVVPEVLPSQINFREDQRHVGDFSPNNLEKYKAIKARSINRDITRLNPYMVDQFQRRHRLRLQNLTADRPPEEPQCKKVKYLKTPLPESSLANRKESSTMAMSELKNLVANPSINFSRKQMMAFKGQPYHARNLSCDVNFKTQYALDHDQHVMRKIGWGTKMQNLQQSYNVKQMPIEDQYHKLFWDHDRTKYHMHTTGFFSKYLDKKFGFGFEDLDKKSVREQKEIITQRARQLHKMTLLKNKYDHRVSTKNKVPQNPMSAMSYDYEIDKRRIKAKSNTTLQTFSSPGKTTGESTMAATGVLFSPLLVRHRDSLYSSAAGPKDLQNVDHLSGSSPHQQMVSTNFDSS